MNAFFALRALLFAGEVLVGSLPIMALAFLGASQKRASARHLTYAAAFAALLVLPLMALIVPSPIRILLPADPQQIPADALRDAASAAVLPPAAGVSLDPLAIAMTLGAFWLAGVMVVALRFAVGAWCLARLKRASRPFALSPEAAPCIAAKARECELRLAHDETGPITWGVSQPVILLPKSATSWPRERLHAVLLHELAHIRRRDSLVQALSLVTCALYWPNPLVWMGAHALRREAEIAADDAVIMAGVKPSSYAGELMRLAADFRAREPALSTVSLYMADRSALEARVESVLAPTSLRTGVTAMDLIRTASLALVSATAMAFAFPSLAQDSSPPPAPHAMTPQPPPAPPSPPSPPVYEISVPDAPPAPAAPPAPPAPPADDIAVPDAPPAPPAPPVPSIRALTAAQAAAMRAEAKAMRKLHDIDWKRIRSETARFRREARRSMERARPQIERAMAEARESERRAMDESRADIERARPEIERAIAQAKISEQAARAMDEARPEFDRAMSQIGPAVELAMTKAREALNKAHIDARIETRVDEALKRATIRIEAGDPDAHHAPTTDSDESVPAN